MKITWEASDIRGGRRVQSTASDEVQVIGFRGELDQQRYVLVSLSDGNITLPQTKEDLAHLLTLQHQWPLEMLA